MMLFTYFLNNTWGFFKSTWLNYQIRTGNYSDLRKFTLKMMLFPITIDALISLPILLFRWDDSLFIVTFYLTSLLSLVSFSFLWSIAYPINIQNKIKKKGNSAFIGLIISFLTISLIASIRNNHLLYLVIPIFIIFSVLSYFLSSYLFSKKKYELFEKLSKE